MIQAQATPARLSTPSPEKHNGAAVQRQYNGTASALVDLLAASTADVRGRCGPAELVPESPLAELKQAQEDGPAALEIVGRVKRSVHARHGDAAEENQHSRVSSSGDRNQELSSEDGRDVGRDGGRAPAFPAEVREQVVDRAEEDVTPLHEELDECEEVQDVLDIVQDEAESMGPARTVMAFVRFAALPLPGCSSSD